MRHPPLCLKGGVILRDPLLDDPYDSLVFVRISFASVLGRDKGVVIIDHASLSPALVGINENQIGVGL